MARTRKPVNTEGAEDSLHGAQDPEKAEAPGAAPEESAAAVAGGGTSATPSPEPGPALIITGPKAGRRRAGRDFGPAPVSVPLADLTEADLAALQADPALTVTLVDAPT